MCECSKTRHTLRLVEDEIETLTLAADPCRQAVSQPPPGYSRAGTRVAGPVGRHPEEGVVEKDYRTRLDHRP
jgi:hypothetical protein